MGQFSCFRTTTLCISAINPFHGRLISTLHQTNIFKIQNQEFNEMHNLTDLNSYEVAQILQVPCVKERLSFLVFSLNQLFYINPTMFASIYPPMFASIYPKMCISIYLTMFASIYPHTSYFVLLSFPVFLYLKDMHIMQSE